jgi:hypothetical protein
VSAFYIGATKGATKAEKPDNSGFGAVIERLNGKQKEAAQ